MDADDFRAPRTAWSSGSTRLLARGLATPTHRASPELIYGNAYFPLSEPVPLGSRGHGDRCAPCRSGARRLRLALEHPDPGSGEGTAGQGELSANRFAGAPLTPQKLRRRADSHVASLSEDGAIGAILARIGRRVADDEIARELALLFPHRFRTWQDALAEVGEMAMKYST